MLLSAAEELGLDLGSSFMIGDRPADAEAGRRAGCRTLLFAGPGVESGDADYVASGWGDAVTFILGSGVPA
jgi:D-glycero-D-manno-heptose 1,7-bisphosphate phosphatase